MSAVLGVVNLVCCGLCLGMAIAFAKEGRMGWVAFCLFLSAYNLLVGLIA